MKKNNRLLKLVLVTLTLSIFVFDGAEAKKPRGKHSSSKVSRKSKAASSKKSTTSQQKSDDQKECSAGFSEERLKEAAHYPLKPFLPLEPLVKTKISGPFEVTPGLKTPVEFWRNVFAHVGQAQTLVHDNLYLGIVYGLLDFSEIYNDESLSNDARRTIRNRVESVRKCEIAGMLKGFEQGQVPRSGGEKLVYSLFEKISDADKFAEAQDRIRNQWGQKDRFMAGMIRSLPYMPLMEKIFEAEGTPKDLSKLCFVESMFTLNALSKVGAAGPWQFMPETGRRYLSINKIVDERRDPLLASQAAARYLLRNYNIAGSWPLAINGYNSGIGRMTKAVEQLGTKDIAVIIKRFQDSGYKFASRNFYPEFLAAVEVYNNHKTYFGDLGKSNIAQWDDLTLPTTTSLYNLAETTNTDIQVLRDLNPSYFENYFAPGSSVPKGYSIRVPHQSKPLFLAAFKGMQDAGGEKIVRVAKGESLKEIAQRHKVAVIKIMQANDLETGRLVEGQILKIPSRSEKVVLEQR